jgi:hypothetical protein
METAVIVVVDRAEPTRLTIDALHALDLSSR